jgi:hypothetical protein
MMDDRRTGYRRTTADDRRGPDCSGHKKLTRRPLADAARTTCIVGRNTEGDWVMKLKLAVAALALVIATPTFAAEYYVIQSASNKKCTVASKKPTSDKMTLVGDGTAYKSKKEARTALKAADACKA